MSIIEKALEKTALEKTSGKPLDREPTDEAPKHQDQAPNLQDQTSDFQHQGQVSVGDEAAVTYDVKIDLQVLEERGMLIPESTQSLISDEYRVIKRPLIINAFGEASRGITNSNLILVTSSLPGEGKTFTAVNLALSIATERDKTVLLVDADVEKPTVSKLFNIHRETGLTDILLDSNAISSDMFLRTSIPNLSILPAGKRHKHSTELLASESMKRLTTEMSKRYGDRIIIFDSPPLMVATQGSVLASHVGQVVMVIETDVTPQYVVKEAVSKLESCDVVGCVLNKTKKGFGFNYYAYYGYYGR